MILAKNDKKWQGRLTETAIWRAGAGWYVIAEGLSRNFQNKGDSMESPFVSSLRQKSKAAAREQVRRKLFPDVHIPSSIVAVTFYGENQ